VLDSLSTETKPRRSRP